MNDFLRSTRFPSATFTLLPSTPYKVRGPDSPDPNPVFFSPGDHVHIGREPFRSLNALTLLLANHLTSNCGLHVGISLPYGRERAGEVTFQALTAPAVQWTGGQYTVSLEKLDVVAEYLNRDYFNDCDVLLFHGKAHMTPGEVDAWVSMVSQAKDRMIITVTPPALRLRKHADIRIHESNHGLETVVVRAEGKDPNSKMRLCKLNMTEIFDGYYKRDVWNER